MARRQVYWVSPHPHRGWAVKKEDSRKAVQTFDDKADAIRRAK